MWSEKKSTPVPLVALVVLILALAPPSSFAQAGKILDRLPFEAIVDIVWQGQEIQVRKVLSCNMRRRLYPVDRPTSVDPGQNLRMQEVWDQDVSRIYHVLPSKEVLIFVLPVVCQPLKKSLYSIPDGFLPITYWVDNADTPAVGERIVYYQYFTVNPYRQFELRQFRIAEARHLADKIDNDQRLVWLFQSSAVKKDAYFVGASAVAIPKSIWSRYTVLASELSKHAESVLIDRSLVQQTARNLLEFCEARSLGIGLAEKCPVGPFDDRPLVISAALISKGLWRLDYEDIGVRRYAHHIRADQIDRAGCNPSFVICNLYKGTYRLEIEGKAYEFSKEGGHLVFDAKRQVLLHLRFGFVSSTFDYTAEVDK